MTVFINSHLLGEVESFCEYVAIMRKGKLVVEGKISELLATTGFTVNASRISDCLPERNSCIWGHYSSWTEWCGDSISGQ